MNKTGGIMDFSYGKLIHFRPSTEGAAGFVLRICLKTGKESLDMPTIKNASPPKNTLLRHVRGRLGLMYLRLSYFRKAPVCGIVTSCGVVIFPSSTSTSRKGNAMISTKRFVLPMVTGAFQMARSGAPCQRNRVGSKGSRKNRPRTGEKVIISFQGIRRSSPGETVDTGNRAFPAALEEIALMALITGRVIDLVDCLRYGL